MATVKTILEKKGNQVYSVGPEQTVYEALMILAEKEIGALLVMEGDKILGIFSERDYARKLVLKGFFSKEVLVKDFMTKDLISESPQTDIFECMSLMTKNRIRHIPIIDKDNLVGIISIGDLVSNIIHSQEETIDSLKSYIQRGGYI